jgi:hypothetical protein
MKIIDIEIEGEMVEMLVNFDQQTEKAEEFIRIYKALDSLAKKAGFVLNVEFVKNLYEKEFWSRESSSMGVPVTVKGWREKDKDEFSFFEKKYTLILGKDKNAAQLRVAAQKFFGV